jgi:hypothetical protein
MNTQRTVPKHLIPFFLSENFLRGCVQARRLVATEYERGSDDYRVNMQRMNELEEQIKDARGRRGSMRGVL